MAAELKVVQPNVKVTLAHSRDKLLSAEPLPDDVKDVTLELTREAGVEVLMNHRLVRSTPAKNASGADVFEVEFENGHKMVASQVVMAISKSVPSTDFLPKAALSDEGLVNVVPSLQLASADVPNASVHFAVGDLINWSGIKRCGAAMHEGKFAGLNIHQLMLQELAGKAPEFNELAEIPPMIGLAVGKNGVSYGPEGMKSGPTVMTYFFEEDLGFRSTRPLLPLPSAAPSARSGLLLTGTRSAVVWDYLRLGQAAA